MIIHLIKQYLTTMTNFFKPSRIIAYFVTIALISSLIGCSSMPRTVSISESELQSKLAEHIAIPITLLKIFNVSLSNPTIKLDSGTERIYAHIDTQVDNPLSRKPLLGKLDISGKLKFDATASAIMLTDSKLENFNMDGLSLDKKSTQYAELAQLLSAKLGSELLNNLVLYKVKPEDLKIGSTRYLPQDFKIRTGTLEVTLMPQK